MISRIIEYIRKKESISITELTLDVCSEAMYYKFIQGSRNLTEAKLLKIKERLGYVKLSMEEEEILIKELDSAFIRLQNIDIFKSEFYSLYSKFKDENYIYLLNERINKQYILLLSYYYFWKLDIKTGLLILNFLNDDDIETLPENIKLFYYSQLININYHDQRIREKYINKLKNTLDLIQDKTKYGYFYLQLAYSYVRMQKRTQAHEMCKKAEEILKLENNFIGILKEENMKATLLIDVQKYDEALNILLKNIENAKRLSCNQEVITSIAMIIYCCSIKHNHAGLKYYYNELINNLELYLSELQLSNLGLIILSALDIANLEKETKQWISIILTKIRLESVESIVNEYCDILLLTDKFKQMHLIEKKILPIVQNNVGFYFRKYLYEKLINFYESEHMYKKTVEIQKEYLEVFKEYYLY